MVTYKQVLKKKATQTAQPTSTFAFSPPNLTQRAFFPGIKTTPQTFHSVFSEALGKFGPLWLQRFQQDVKKNPAVYSKIFTPKSVYNFGHNWNSLDAIPVMERNPLLQWRWPRLPKGSPIKNMHFSTIGSEPSTISAYSPANSGASKWHMLYSRIPDELQSITDVEKPDYTQLTKPSIEKNNGVRLAQLHALVNPDKYAAEAKKHEFLHALTVTGAKNRLLLNRMQPGYGSGYFSLNYLPIVDKAIFDPYIFSDTQHAQMAMAANQGRNWLAYQLKRNPKAFPKIHPDTRQFLTKRMPFFWDKDPDIGWNQAKNFYRMVRQQPALYQALPVQAQRYYKNFRQLQEKIPTLPLRRRLLQVQQLPIQFEDKIDQDTPGPGKIPAAHKVLDEWEQKRTKVLRDKGMEQFKRYYRLSQNKKPTYSQQLYS